MTYRDGYRLTVAIRRLAGGYSYSPLPGDDRIFDTWKDANEAVQKHRAAGVGAAVQAVQLDAEGTVVWPPPGRETFSRGHWTRAPMVRPARRIAMPGHSEADRGKRSGRCEKRTPRKAARQATPKQKCSLDPRVAARIAEIRTTDPGFGRGQSSLPGSGGGP